VELKVQNPRKHHYLPVSYLRNFSAEDGCLYVYEREKPIRKSIPKREAHVRDFYAYDGPEGKNFDFEKILSHRENEVAPVLQGILDREITKQRRLLTTAETETLRQFLALTFVRVPAGRKFDEEHAGPAAQRLLFEAAHDPQKFAAMVKDIPDDEESSEQERTDLVEEARQRILGGFFSEPEPPGMRLFAMLHVASMIADELKQYACRIVIAPKHENFITGDTPIVTATEEHGGTHLGTSFATLDNMVWFPIANKVCLLWRRGIEPGYGRLPPRGVRMANRNVMRFAERFIYSKSHSTRLAETFARIKQEIQLGVNAFIPTWEGKPIQYK
jgi:hypothetical protein